MNQAKFIGYQDNGMGKAFPLFNVTIPNHPLNGSTVSLQTLAKEGIAFPEFPSYAFYMSYRTKGDN